jgi:hypothetical protein
MKLHSVDSFRSYGYVLITVAILRFTKKSLICKFYNCEL